MRTAALSKLAVTISLVAVPLACADDGSAQTVGVADEGTSTTDLPPTTTTAEPTTTGTSGSSTSTEDTGFVPPRPACGNGFVEPGEDCDDGNRDELDACPNDCVFACSIEWDLVRSGPTLDSTIYGVSVAADEVGNVYALAYQREIDVDPKGVATIGDDTTVVLALDPSGRERWSTLVGTRGLAIDPGAIAVDGDGVPYVALTRESEMGGSDVQVLQISPDDGAISWTHDLVTPLVGGDDEAEAIAAGQDGAIVVTARVAIADGDYDAWTRKLDTIDGTELWTTTFTGPDAGAISTDNAGPVAVGADGTVAVLVQAYVDFSAAPATLVVYGASGGEPLWTWTPVDDGASQELAPIGVAVDADGNVYAAYQRVTPSNVRFWVVKLDAAGNELWVLGDEHFVGRDLDWSLSGLGEGANGLALVGNYNAVDGGDSWVEGWIAQTDHEAVPLCLFTAQGEGGRILPPGLFSNDGTVAPSGKVLVVGQWIDQDEQALWLAQLRAFGR